MPRQKKLWNFGVCRVSSVRYHHNYSHNFTLEMEKILTMGIIQWTYMTLKNLNTHHFWWTWMWWLNYLHNNFLTTKNLLIVCFYSKSESGGRTQIALYFGSPAIIRRISSGRNMSFCRIIWWRWCRGYRDTFNFVSNYRADVYTPPHSDSCLV